MTAHIMYVPKAEAPLVVEILQRRIAPVADIRKIFNDRFVRKELLDIFTPLSVYSTPEDKTIIELYTDKELPDIRTMFGDARTTYMEYIVADPNKGVKRYMKYGEWKNHIFEYDTVKDLCDDIMGDIGDLSYYMREEEIEISPAGYSKQHRRLAVVEDTDSLDFCIVSTPGVTKLYDEPFESNRLICYESLYGVDPEVAFTDFQLMYEISSQLLRMPIIGTIVPYYLYAEHYRIANSYINEVYNIANNACIDSGLKSLLNIK